MYKEDGYTSDSDRSTTWCIHQQKHKVICMFTMYLNTTHLYKTVHTVYVQHAQRVHRLVLHLKV